MSAELDLSDPEQNCGQQVRRCYRRFTSVFNSVFAKYGLKPGCWYYLRVLWLEDGVSQKYLSDRAYVAENTTASIVNSMLKEGLITRKRNEEDKRQYSVFLTERGRRLEKEVLGYAKEINELAMSGIDLADIRTCLSVLKRMSENLENALDT